MTTYYADNYEEITGKSRHDDENDKEKTSILSKVITKVTSSSDKNVVTK